MTAYLVMTLTIEDEARWGSYRDAVIMPLIARFGGRHMTGAGALERLEGPYDGRRVAMFASMADVQAFWGSPDYAAVKGLRRGAATLDAWAVPGA